MTLLTFSFPTTIRFGAGARHEVPDAVLAAGCRRPLLVADEGLAALPLFGEIREALATAGLDVETFTAFGGNPLRSHVRAGAEAFGDHGGDAIVGLGGGAALDVAKAIGLAASNPGDIFEYEDVPTARPVESALPFWVAIPSTAGTGSEVGRSAVIADDETHRKVVVFSPALLARAVFADPEVLVGLPAGLTAATGMDAVTHCVEAYLAEAYHPMCDGIALEGLHLAAGSLVRCVREPGDLAARADMLMASMMGAVAFQKGLGLVHSCAHALSTLTDVHHGMANGVLIDHALAFNLVAAPEKFVRLAEAVGLEQRTGDAFLAWLTALKSDIGIPAGLEDLGLADVLDDDRIDGLLDVAVADVCHLSNPRPVTVDDFRAVFLGAR